MKIKMTKKGQIRYCQDYEQTQLESAGWTLAQEQAQEEIIRLKPAVKPRATVRVLEEAKTETEKGDE